MDEDEKDLYDLYNKMLGSELEGMEIDEEEEVFRINTNRGTISIEGQDLTVYIETDRYEH